MSAKAKKPAARKPAAKKPAAKKPAKKPVVKKEEEVIKMIVIPEVITLKDLADKMKMKPADLIKKLFLKGKMVTLNTELSYEEAEEIVAINQLRRYLAQYPLGEQREGNVMTFETDKGTYKLYEKRGKLMVHPGAMTFLSGIRNLTFYEQGDFIYMSFWRNGKERNVWIAINE